jgi:hypothetical protein
MPNHPGAPRLPGDDRPNNHPTTHSLKATSSAVS